VTYVSSYGGWSLYATNPNLTDISSALVFYLILSTNEWTLCLVYYKYVSIDPVVSTTKTTSMIPATGCPGSREYYVSVLLI
jgi:hypothetical protein